MNYLTNYYKNLCEDLQQKINFLNEELSQETMNEIKATLAALKKFDEEGEKLRNRVNPLTGNSVNQVADEAFKASRQREEEKEERFARDMPNLAANLKFRSQSSAMSGTPSPVTGTAGKYGRTYDSDLRSLSALSPDEQQRVIPGLRTPDLNAMKTQQLKTSVGNIMTGRGSQQLGAGKVSALNQIDAELQDRRTNAMGGKDAAASYARTWSEDPTSARTKRSMEVRTPQERTAMNDAMQEEGLRILREKGKASPEWANHIKAVNQMNRTYPEPSTTLSKFAKSAGAGIRETEGEDQYMKTVRVGPNKKTMIATNQNPSSNIA